MVDLNKYSPAFFEPDIVPDPTGLGEAVEAVEGLRVAPLVEALGNRIAYGSERQPGYDPLEDLGNYTPYASYLAPMARSPEHMAELKRGIDRGIERRQTLSQAGLLTQLTAGLADPINFLALPLGGPSTSFLQSAARVGTGVAMLEAGAELAVAPFDPVKTAEEAALNVGMAGLFGGALGGAASIPIARRAAALEQTELANRELFDAATRIENLQGMTPEQIQNAPPRAERPLGDLEDVDIQTRIREIDEQATKLEAEGSVDRAKDVRAGATALRNELGIRQIEDLGIDLKDPYNIKSSVFTDSFLYKMVSTPMKRTLQRNVPSKVKETFVKSFGDSGVTLALNSIGAPSPQSVYQRTAVAAGKWVKAHDELSRLWAADTGASPASRLDLNATDLARRATRSPLSYREWLTNVSEKRIKGDENLSENEIKAASVINDYFATAEKNLEEVGLINSPRGIQRQIEMLSDEIAQLKEGMNATRGRVRDMTEARVNLLESRVKFLTEAKTEPTGTTPKDAFFPRFFDQSAIRSRRDEFSQILYRWFEENPFVYQTVKGTTERVELSRFPEKIQERVDRAIDNILGEGDPLSLDVITFGAGRSKHFRSRELDIPNRLVSDFIIKDPLAVMKTYAARVEPRYEFAKQFGRDLDGVLFDIEREMLRAGVKQDEINAVLRDYRHMYNRVAGAVLENPDALSQKAAFVLREAASFSYMGSSGLAAIPDFGRIILEHDMENIVRGVQGILDRDRLNMTVDEVRIAGEAIDILKGSAHMRMMEDMSNNIDSNELLTTARNAFYILNGLAPITTIAKQLSGIIEAHTIIDSSIKLAGGKLDAQGIERLARYGIGEDMARKIARAPWQKTENGLYMANTEEWADHVFIPEIDNKRVTVIELNEDGTPPGKTRNGRYIPAFYNDKKKTINFDREYIEGQMFNEKGWLNPKVEGVNALPDIFDTPRQWANFVMLHEINHSRFRPEDLGIDPKNKAEYENKINELALKDYREAQTINKETVDSFRSALNSGVLNTIMSGTPADKPIITDGVVYIPMSVASKFGMKEHPKYRGYARIENGLMGLPFQFYSFVLANVNKTVAAMAHGQVKNRAIGIATMMGLAYMSLKLRTPDYIWEDMSWQDRFARSFDMSGVMALYSDLFYTSMHTSLALGGPNITGGLLQPKFKQEQSFIDAATGLAGAGPSWAYDTAQGIVNFASGNYGEGAKDVIRNMPFARMWFLKDDVNQITNAWAN